VSGRGALQSVLDSDDRPRRLLESFSADFAELAAIDEAAYMEVCLPMQLLLLLGMRALTVYLIYPGSRMKIQLQIMRLAPKIVCSFSLCLFLQEWRSAEHTTENIAVEVARLQNLADAVDVKGEAEVAFRLVQVRLRAETFLSRAMLHIIEATQADATPFLSSLHASKAQG
jgi:hypothetical protein